MLNVHLEPQVNVFKQRSTNALFELQHAVESSIVDIWVRMVGDDLSSTIRREVNNTNEVGRFSPFL